MNSPFRNPDQRAEERRRKREALLLAAVQMFNERGFHATSLDEVATRVGVTKPVIYHHLGNKDRVLRECMRIGLAELEAAAEEARGAPGAGLDRLALFLARYAEVMMRDFGRCVVRTEEGSLSPDSREQIRCMKHRVDQALRGMIQAAVDDGSATVADVRLTAFAFAGALNWPARWHRPEGPMAPGAIARGIAALLISGIAPRN